MFDNSATTAYIIILTILALQLSFILLFGAVSVYTYRINLRYALVLSAEFQKAQFEAMFGEEDDEASSVDEHFETAIR